MDNIIQLKDLPFFFCEEKITNFYKNNKIESYILFTTPIII